ncbi:hypothetical protein BDR26DRAFT_902870 [Obelidium mucronatum]|nr:hypothetical protein BDR26DRAFT_902870 [Obelidium mucronatum]
MRVMAKLLTTWLICFGLLIQAFDRPPAGKLVDEKITAQEDYNRQQQFSQPTRVTTPEPLKLPDEKREANADYQRQQQGDQREVCNRQFATSELRKGQPLNSEGTRRDFGTTDLIPNLRLGSHIRTRILVNGKDQWAMCDTGAQATILNSTWAAANSIGVSGKARLRVVGFDNIPQQVTFNVSEPVEFVNFNGKLQTPALPG